MSADRGGLAGLEDLFRSHYPALCGALTAGWGDREAAADAVQHAFAQAWRRWGEVGGFDDPVAWVRRVAVNHLRNQARGRRRQAAAVARLGVTDEGGGTGVGWGRVDVVRAVAGLPARQREAVSLFYLLDLPVREVAASMGLSEGAVRFHLHQARASLESALEESR